MIPAATNPQPDDAVFAKIGKKQVCRRVVKRDGGNITYHDSRFKGEKTCWISTWTEWCVKYKAMQQGHGETPT